MVGLVRIVTTQSVRMGGTIERAAKCLPCLTSGVTETQSGRTFPR